MGENGVGNNRKILLGDGESDYMDGWMEKVKRMVGKGGVELLINFD